jgi:hypothetical protein
MKANNFEELYGFSLLPENMRSTLIKYGEHIVSADSLINDMHKQFSDIDLACVKLDSSTGSHVNRDGMLAHMQDREIIEKTLVPAMLATKIQRIGVEHLDFQQLQAFVYLASKMINDKNGANIVGEAAREVRLMAVSQHRAKFWKYFSREETGFSGFKNKLNEFQDLEKFRGVRINRIMRLIQLVDELINPKEKSEGKRKKSSVSKMLKIIKSSNRIMDDDFRVSNIYEVGRDNQQERTGIQIDQVRKLINIEPIKSSQIDRDRALKSTQAKAIANDFSMREILPPARYGGLTKDEVKFLVAKIYQEVERKNIAYVVIAIMLFFGRDAKTAISILFRKKDELMNDVLWQSKKLCAIKYTMRFPIIKSSLYEDLNLSDIGDSLLLPLPMWLNDVVSLKEYKTAYKNTDLMAAVESAIKALNIHENIRFTKTAISNVAFEWLRRTGVSESNILWIIGGTPQEYASLYYYSTSEYILREIHKNYLDTLGRLSGVEMAPIQIVDSNKILGSRITLSLEKVRSIAAKVLGEEVVLENRTKESIVEFHNKFLWRCYFIFSLFSAHRAVNNPFQSILDFDCYSKSLWISDKDNRSAQSSRVIPLADVVVEQYQNLIAHYEKLARWLRPIDKLLSQQVEAILEGERGVFFLSWIYLDRLEGVSTGKIQAHFEKMYCLPANWQRHFLRQYLSVKNHSQDQINAFMGHANFGRESHGRWSSYSSESSGHIRASLNWLAKELQINSIKGLG